MEHISADQVIPNCFVLITKMITQYHRVSGAFRTISDWDFIESFISNYRYLPCNFIGANDLMWHRSDLTHRAAYLAYHNFAIYHCSLHENGPRVQIYLVSCVNKLFSHLLLCELFSLSKWHVYIRHQGPLITRATFNPDMDKLLHSSYNVRWNYLSFSKPHPI